MLVRGFTGTSNITVLPNSGGITIVAEVVIIQMRERSTTVWNEGVNIYG